MAKWKDISKLSPKDESARAAAFEAAMIAELTKNKGSEPAKPAQSSAPRQPVATPAVAPASDAVAITVTENGKPTTYPTLASVPLALRQRIVNEWLAAPNAG